jgi:excisionase family DNA binding protein
MASLDSILAQEERAQAIVVAFGGGEEAEHRRAQCLELGAAAREGVPDADVAKSVASRIVHPHVPSARISTTKPKRRRHYHGTPPGCQAGTCHPSRECAFACGRMTKAVGRRGTVPRYIGTDEVARRLGVTPTWVRLLARRGDLPEAARVGRWRLFHPAAVEAFKKARAKAR